MYEVLRSTYGVIRTLAALQQQCTRRMTRCNVSLIDAAGRARNDIRRIVLRTKDSLNRYLKAQLRYKVHEEERECPNVIRHVDGANSALEMMVPTPIDRISTGTLLLLKSFRPLSVKVSQSGVPVVPCAICHSLTAQY